MNVLKKKLKELVYSFSTDDHYAEYNANDGGRSFNMRRRANQGAGVSGSRVHLNGGDELGDEEMNLGAVEEEEDEINIDEFGNMDKEGVSEALLAWRHIDSWTSKHNPDLNATLGDPCTHNDITHAEEDLAVTLPAAVRVSLRVHDGQEDLESMTGVSGLIYGLQLMTLDQIVEMTEKWRSVAKNLDRVSKADRETTVSSSSQSAEATKRKQFKLPHIPRQDSIPKNSIQPVYAHPAWIPLLTDNAGNHVGVDLAPASEGKYAQVIIFGRDFDTKFVVAANWGDFLLDFANDLEAGNWYLVDDNDDFLSGDGELVFRDKKSNGPVQDYLEVLKKRAWTKYQESAKSRDTQQTAVEPENAKDATQIGTVALTDGVSAHEGAVQEVQVHPAVKEVPEAGKDVNDREPTSLATEKTGSETHKTEETEAVASSAQSQANEESSKARGVSDEGNSKESTDLKNEQVKNDSEENGDAQDSNVETLKDEFKNIDL
ncbi:hypothetical protein HG536_0A01230 [Torulaspora globosa]|uniref:Knr4/Smi1-like domain-containing protein n=1 Tax=Torulaspora globosa TaxID=48254 RepID=A0A7G3Z9X0_9SACH|nr:uncharacterized protein HG536_0A01230 [Torulaspora globosa]QLL30306.1 hypothetical protein HG536_0A01230 [Torulaspora globosa]